MCRYRWMTPSRLCCRAWSAREALLLPSLESLLYLGSTTPRGATPPPLTSHPLSQALPTTSVTTTTQACTIHPPGHPACHIAVLWFTHQLQRPCQLARRWDVRVEYRRRLLSSSSSSSNSVIP